MQYISAVSLIAALESMRTQINATLTTETDLTERDKALLEGKILGLIAAKNEIQARGNIPDKIMCDCGHLESDCSSITQGYVTYGGQTYCYPCSVEHVKTIMRETGKYTLYLTWDAHQVWAHLSDWTASFTLPVETIKVGKHNRAGKRYDVWFMFAGERWHGVTYGDSSQLCYVKRLRK